MFDGAERVWIGLNLLASDNVNSPTSRPVRMECLLATSAAWFSSEMGEKLIELVRKCIEKYSDIAWKEKLWGQIGEVTIILISPKF